MRVSGVSLSLSVALLFTFTVLPAVPAEPTTADATVQVSNFQFTPTTVTIQTGEQVTWDWASGTHSVETSDGTDVWCDVRSSGSCSKTFPDPGTYAYVCGVHPGSMQATVVVEGEVPQVAIQSPADGIQVEDDLLASGDASHSSGIAAVQWRVDTAAYQPVDTLDVIDGEASWSTQVPVEGLAVGGHSLTVRATAGDGTTATATVAFSVVAPDTTDLQVTVLTTSEGLQTSRLRAVVHNAGTSDVDGTTLRFEYQNHGTWRTIGTATFDISAGGNVSRGIVWDGDGKIGAFAVRAVVDPDDAIPESDEANNLRQGSAAFGSALVPGIDPHEPV